MMSDKCAPALDVSVEEQDSFGSFGEDSVQTLLSLALADPERAKKLELICLAQGKVILAASTFRR